MPRFVMTLLALLFSSAALAGPPTDGWIRVQDGPGPGSLAGFYLYDSSDSSADGSVTHWYKWEPPAAIGTGEPTTVGVFESTDAYGNKTYTMTHEYTFQPVTQDDQGNDLPVGGTNVE